MCRLDRIEADAVVLDLEQQPAVVAAQADRDVLRPRVTERVLQSFLGDAQHVAVSRRVRRQLAVEVELDLALLKPAQQLDMLGERAAESVALEVGRAELEDE